MALPPLMPVLLRVHTPLSAELNSLLGLSPLLLILSQPLLRAVTVVCGFAKQGKGTKYSVGGTAGGGVNFHHESLLMSQGGPGICHMPGAGALTVQHDALISHTGQSELKPQPALS